MDVGTLSSLSVVKDPLLGEEPLDVESPLVAVNPCVAEDPSDAKDCLAKGFVFSLLVDGDFGLSFVSLSRRTGS